MTKLLKGGPVVQELNLMLARRSRELAGMGVPPRLAIIRVGENAGDVAYERGALKRCSEAGIQTRCFRLGNDADEGLLRGIISDINNDDSIHGCLLLRPLPEQMSDERVRSALLPDKDVDGITAPSLAGAFTGTDEGYRPCTPLACIELLRHYGYPIEGRRAVVIGRSLVVGRPVAMLLLAENATVTLCHTKTLDLPGICAQADILISAAGCRGLVGRDCLRSGQVVIDVGINEAPDGSLCGDVDMDAALGTVEAISPVPGGVGAVTTAMLAKNVITAAERALAGRPH